MAEIFKKRSWGKSNIMNAISKIVNGSKTTEESQWREVLLNIIKIKLW